MRFPRGEFVTGYLMGLGLRVSGFFRLRIELAGARAALAGPSFVRINRNRKAFIEVSLTNGDRDRDQRHLSTKVETHPLLPGSTYIFNPNFQLFNLRYSHKTREQEQWRHGT